MSSGPFKIAKYQDDKGVVRPIRIQPETITEDNPEADGSIVPDRGFVFARSRKRGYGTYARTVTLSRVVGTGANTAQKYQSVPILTQTAYESLAEGETFAYNGVDWTVAYKTPERRR